jgi:hypothetical protein
MKCEEYKNLIERCVEGTISDNQLAELKTHTETCESCREEFDCCVLMAEAIKHAFLSRTTAERVRASLVARLSAEPRPGLRDIRAGGAWLTGRRTLIAASILLAIGLFLGFALGRAGKHARAPLMAQVPISVGKVEGTVLLRHEGSEVWRILKAGSNVYLGDTFHSTAMSACVLKLYGESTLELNQNSMLVLKLYNGETQFHLEHGELAAALESQHPPFFISTPHGRARALGTEFTVKVIDE